MSLKQPGPLSSLVVEAIRMAEPDKRAATVSHLVRSSTHDQLTAIFCDLAAEVLRLQQSLAESNHAPSCSTLISLSASASHVVLCDPSMPQLKCAARSDNTTPPRSTRHGAFMGSDTSLLAPTLAEGSLVSFVEDPFTIVPNSPDNAATPAGSRVKGAYESRATSSMMMNASATTMSRSAVVVTRGETFDAVNDLEFIHQIGHGAQATVWLCVDVTSGEPRAVKVIDRSKCFGANDDGVGDGDGCAGLAEIEAAMRLQHENVIRLFEVIDDPACQAIFLVMEYVEGGACGSVCGETGECATGLTVGQVTELAAGAAQGLQYCHARGVVHGDIKPENILVAANESDTGAPIRAVLADFGVANLEDDANSTHSYSASGRRQQSFHIVSRTASGAALANDIVASRRASWQSGTEPSDSAERLFMSQSGDAGNVLTLPSFSPVGGVTGVVAMPPRVVSAAASGPCVVRRFSLPPECASATPQLQLPASANRAARLTSPTDPFVVQPQRRPPQSHGAPRDRRISLKDVGHVLAQKTRDLQRHQSEALRANFAKRGAKTVGGTPAFQAPELLCGGQPTPASDMWALGVTLFALLFKRLPWHGATWAELKDAVCGQAAAFPASSVTEREHRRWRGVLERLLDKDPATRMTARELEAASVALCRFSSA